MNLAPDKRILLATHAACLLVAGLLAADLAMNRDRELRAGLQRVQRFNVMMAEHTARTFDTVETLLRETAAELGRDRADWPAWNPDEGWNYLSRRQSRTMPQLRALFIYDRRGQPRYASTPPGSPVGRHGPLEPNRSGAPDVVRFGPYLEPATNQFTYALGRRIADAQHNATGYALATVDPTYLQDFCWPNRLTDDFETVLVNGSGQIIASCRPSGLGRQSALLGQSGEDSLFDGQLRGHVPASGNVLAGDFALSMLPVPGFPELRMLTAAPTSSLLTAWQGRLIELGTLGLLLVSGLQFGAWYLRRQLTEMQCKAATLEAGQAELATQAQVAAQALALQRNDAELSNMAKSRFLAAASHDLRQPMHALALFAADLQVQARSGTYRELPRLAEQIGISTTILSELLDSLLDISRLDVAGVKPEIRAFPLQPIFDRVAGSYRRAALDRKLFLRFRFTRLWLESDPALIERMIANLVSNAVRYTPRGGRILVAARKRGERVVIEVRDSGIGIAPEHQAAVFTEFYQIDNSAREHHKGLGLGLSIVDRLARALKVDIDLRSAPHRGTRFTLTVQGSLPQRIAVAEARPELARAMLHFIGDSNEIHAAMRLAISWGYTTAHQADTGVPLPSLPYNTIVVSELGRAHAVRDIWPGNLTLIALAPADTPAGASHTMPEGTRLFPLPIRPAKLRALLGQLQNASSKSIP